MPITTRCLPLALLLLGAGGPAFAAAPCAVLADAFKRSYGVPYHQVVTNREDGQPAQTELIFDGKVLYMKLHGSWYLAGGMDNPFESLAGALDRSAVCTPLNAETLQGMPVSVYRVSQTVEGQTMVTQVWLSPAGLLVQMRALSGEAFELRAEYDGVSAPGGAKRIGAAN